MIVSALLLALAGQNLPPEFRQQKTLNVDPVLPSALASVAARAAEAELDPKRGAGNAAAILEAERANIPKDPAMSISLELRIAATKLRSSFMAENKSLDYRTQKALSTFSKLDLREPALPGWLAKTLDANPEVAKRLSKKGGRTIPVTYLVRGSGIDAGKVHASFAPLFDRLGFELDRVPAERAHYVIEVAADEVRAEDGRRIVRLALELERTESGRVTWRQNLFRTSEGTTASAIELGMVWIASIGGRELFFHYLAEQGLLGVLMRPPSPTGHERGAEPQPERATRVTIPKGQAAEPAPPAAGKAAAFRP
ncbi:MAG: hypothetical protein HYV07_27190 [Deltaproteobacteria bacterium]|nr:hypothetical protein [Deltaproteobacteria bacterium]